MDSTRNTITIFALARLVDLLMRMPRHMPSRSMTAVCASPFAVMSPMLSELCENDLYLWNA